MKCQNCGSKFKEKVSFCTVCGAPMQENNSGKTKAIIVSVVTTLAVCAVAFVLWNTFTGDGETPDSGEAAVPSVETAEGWDDTATESAESQTYDGIAGSDYIIADSDNRYLTSSDLAALSSDELNLARNEIYARRGRRFNSDRLQNYFAAKSWYRGTISPEEFSEDMLSEVERHNVELIVKEEERRGE